MKLVDNSTLLSRCLMGLWVVLATAGQAKSQPNDRNSTLFASYCSQYKGRNREYLSSNLNTTLASLHRQLSINHVSYATARTLVNGDSVWGLASCRGYVSSADCVACFDYAVVQLRTCGFANGGYVFYDDCDIRYENYNFYTESKVRNGLLKCNNGSLTQQAEFSKTTNGLLSDLRIAVPRTSNFYAASLRVISKGNATVYAIGQCNLNLSQSDCVECMDSRYTTLDSCLPSSSGRSMDRGCFMKYSTTPFFRQDQITNIKPLLWDGDSSKRTIIGGVVGGVCFLFVVLAFFLWRIRSKNSSNRHLDKSTGSTVLLQGPTRYSYGDLIKATNNFNDMNKLGGGVFGEVYKGTLKNGDTIAIKKTVMTSTRGNIHIVDELKIICNVHHRHILRLVGYCSKGPFLFLIHEHMDNGSLDQFLYGNKSRNLSWRQRIEIIFGTARGLAYLHEQYHVTIIHRDIKPSNILLDNELQPKIADFGLIRLLPEDKTHLSTKLPGSLQSGYVAPEYAIHGQLSEKVDTYSFGIVVLEIISGKKCHNVKDEESANQNLLDHAWNLYDNGTHLNLVDNTLDPSEYGEEEAKKIIEIALMCTQSPVSARPAMSEVVTLISDRSLDQIPPVRSTFHENDVKIQVGETLTSLSSNATASTVQFSAR
ncbi:cysteine-rich receptor-like protein kinase 44 [Bidens hawaiensis]|uniref:cysteine-rich receptor-like protein kinase 44 n=1 Tax=Bidens hawaiensis TaxID=980011 RepID=UPI00404971C8